MKCYAILFSLDFFKSLGPTGLFQRAKNTYLLFTFKQCLFECPSVFVGVLEGIRNLPIEKVDIITLVFNE